MVLEALTLNHILMGHVLIFTGFGVVFHCCVQAIAFSYTPHSFFTCIAMATKLNHQTGTTLWSIKLHLKARARKKASISCNIYFKAGCDMLVMGQLKRKEMFIVDGWIGGFGDY